MSGVNPLYPTILLIVLSTVLYHVLQKATPIQVNPMISLFITYITAAVLCLVLFPFFGKGTALSEQLHKVNWASVALGAAVLGIEAGFLYAYRVGGNISTTNLISSVLTAVALLAIGYFFYHDQITSYKIVGILLCMAGVILINK
ncbi:MAG TPA: EamA family transporter [Anaerovoracaceae bacterium]|nr:EamA family transporter [Anaerovoracaceae bacterium]